MQSTTFLGKMYMHGHGVQTDYNMAPYHFELAAKSGNAVFADEAKRYAEELRGLMESQGIRQKNTGKVWLRASLIHVEHSFFNFCFVLFCFP